MEELPLSAMDRIIRGASGLRVGLDAREALAKILEEKGTGIAREAGKYAQHANRKTVKAEDIRLAVMEGTSERWKNTEQKDESLMKLEDLATKISQLMKFSTEKKDLVYKKEDRLQLISLMERLIKIPLPLATYDGKYYYIMDSTLHLLIPSDITSKSITADVTADWLLNYLWRDHREGWKYLKKGGGIQIVEGSRKRKTDPEEIRRANPRG